MPRGAHRERNPAPPALLRSSVANRRQAVSAGQGLPQSHMGRCRPGGTPRGLGRSRPSRARRPGGRCATWPATIVSSREAEARPSRPSAPSTIPPVIDWPATGGRDGEAWCGRSALPSRGGRHRGGRNGPTPPRLRVGRRPARFVGGAGGGHLDGAPEARTRNFLCRIPYVNGGRSRRHRGGRRQPRPGRFAAAPAPDRRPRRTPRPPKVRPMPLAPSPRHGRVQGRRVSPTAAVSSGSRDVTRRARVCQSLCQWRAEWAPPGQTTSVATRGGADRGGPAQTAALVS